MTALTAKTDQRLSAGNELAASVPATVIGQNQGHEFSAAAMTQRVATDQPGSFSRGLLVGPDNVRLRGVATRLSAARKRENRGLGVSGRALMSTGTNGWFLADQVLRIVDFVRPEDSHGDALP